MWEGPSGTWSQARPVPEGGEASGSGSGMRADEEDAQIDQDTPNQETASDGSSYASATELPQSPPIETARQSTTIPFSAANTNARQTTYVPIDATSTSYPMEPMTNNRGTSPAPRIPTPAALRSSSPLELPILSPTSSSTSTPSIPAFLNPNGSQRASSPARLPPLRSPSSSGLDRLPPLSMHALTGPEVESPNELESAVRTRGAIWDLGWIAQGYDEAPTTQTPPPVSSGITNSRPQESQNEVSRTSRPDPGNAERSARPLRALPGTRRVGSPPPLGSSRLIINTGVNFGSSSVDSGLPTSAFSERRMPLPRVDLEHDWMTESTSSGFASRAIHSGSSFDETDPAPLFPPPRQESEHAQRGSSNFSQPSTFSQSSFSTVHQLDESGPAWSASRPSDLGSAYSQRLTESGMSYPSSRPSASDTSYPSFRANVSTPGLDTLNMGSRPGRLVRDMSWSFSDVFRPGSTEALSGSSSDANLREHQHEDNGREGVRSALSRAARVRGNESLPRLHLNALPRATTEDEQSQTWTGANNNMTASATNLSRTPPGPGGEHDVPSFAEAWLEEGSTRARPPTLQPRRMSGGPRWMDLFSESSSTQPVAVPTAQRLSNRPRMPPAIPMSSADSTLFDPLSGMSWPSDSHSTQAPPFVEQQQQQQQTSTSAQDSLARYQTFAQSIDELRRSPAHLQQPSNPPANPWGTSNAGTGLRLPPVIAPSTTTAFPTGLDTARSGETRERDTSRRRLTDLGRTSATQTSRRRSFMSALDTEPISPTSQWPRDFQRPSSLRQDDRSSWSSTESPSSRPNHFHEQLIRAASRVRRRRTLLPESSTAPPRPRPTSNFLDSMGHALHQVESGLQHINRELSALADESDGRIQVAPRPPTPESRMDWTYDDPSPVADRSASPPPRLPPFEFSQLQRNVDWPSSRRNTRYEEEDERSALSTYLEHRQAQRDALPRAIRASYTYDTPWPGESEPWANDGPTPTRDRVLFRASAPSRGDVPEGNATRARILRHPDGRDNNASSSTQQQQIPQPTTSFGRLHHRRASPPASSNNPPPAPTSASPPPPPSRSYSSRFSHFLPRRTSTSRANSDDNDEWIQPGSGSGSHSRMFFLRPRGRMRTTSTGDFLRDEEFDDSYEGLLRLAARIGDAKPRGTPAEVIQAMPTGRYASCAGAKAESRCPICLDDYGQEDIVALIKGCSHWFHKECITQWLGNSRTCPVCRGQVDGEAGTEPEAGPSSNVSGDMW
ncbi:hypothetical protein FRC07_000686 [Ceratobasidium sp. 392]|nr:hypothetical protein FRC07_000686 [Ceratobasidium sp. 392]